MATFFKWLFALPFIAGAVAFSITNPEAVSVVWSPMHEKITLPLYAVLLSFMGIGFLLGAIMTWFGMGKLRKERRTLKKENKRLEKDLDKLNQEEKVTDPLLKQVAKEKKEIEHFTAQS
ncbi:MAG: LapA family protein [Pseudomonadota bacterium]